MTTELIPLEIDATPGAIRATLAEARPAARKAAEAIRGRLPRRIFVIGNGTSLYTSMAATYTARQLAGPEDPLVLAFPAGDFRYFTPAVRPDDVIVRRIIDAAHNLVAVKHHVVQRNCRQLLTQKKRV